MKVIKTQINKSIAPIHPSVVAVEEEVRPVGICLHKSVYKNFGQTQSQNVSSNLKKMSKNRFIDNSTRQLVMNL